MTTVEGAIAALESEGNDDMNCVGQIAGRDIGLQARTASEIVRLSSGRGLLAVELPPFRPLGLPFLAFPSLLARALP